QRRILDARRKLREQRPHVGIFTHADFGRTVIFLRREYHHHRKQRCTALRVALRQQRRQRAHQLRGGNAQNLIDFRVHPSVPNRSASTWLWKARQYQPEKALTASLLRPSEYSRAAEIQIARPLRLAKISHQWSARGSAFRPLSLSQIA